MVKNKKFTITGCAGFIGSTLTDYLLKQGHYVLGIDNLSTGKELFLNNALNNNRFNFIKDDIKNIENHKKHIAKTDLIFHMA